MNICNKIESLLRHHYNLFHSDMIFDAIMDYDISTEDFIQGVKAIGWAEQNDDDEYVPVQFKHLVND